MLALFVCISILFAYTFNPYIYSCITWNYSLFVFTLLFMYTNFIIYLVVFAVYLISPTEIIDNILKNIFFIFRTIFSNSIEKTEINIKETFKIHVQIPIPKRAILLWHPHGVSGVTPVIHNGYKLTDKSYTPTKGVVHSFFFSIPLVKDIIRFLNAIPSDYGSIKKTVEKESISLTVGGIEEMGIIKNKCMELKIKQRKGIFKIALETGTPIVPVLTYGENEIFPETDNTFLICYNNWLYDMFKIRMPFPSFKSVKNWLRLSVEPLEPIHTYTGRPIYVKKIDKPTEKHIKTLRNIYIKRLRELFTETNPGEFSLKIV